MKKAILISVVLAGILNAGSVGGFGGSLEVTQWERFGAETMDRANAYMKQVQQYSTQIESYKNQFKSYEMMLSNLKKLPKAQWDEFSKSVMGLKKSLEFGQAVSYTSSSIDADFKKFFPDFNEYAKGLENGNLDFQDEYKRLNNGTKQAVKNTLKTLNLQAEDMKDDESTMKELSRLSQSATGQKAAVQAANQIALHQTHTFKKLQQTMMTQANVENTYIASKVEKEDLSQAMSEQKAIGGIEPTVGDEQQVGAW